MARDSQLIIRLSDLPPAAIVNPAGASAIVLIGDHAGNRVPPALGNLGLEASDLARHIGWDIGVDALGRRLAVLLDAVFVAQRYSRLVIDCNRDPGSAEAIPAASDGTAIPGNAGLTAADAQARIAEIHEPYQAAIAAVLDDRPASILVSLHSFTPVLAGQVRPWELGVLHDGREDGFARRLLDWLQRNTTLAIGDNEPYRMDATDYTVPRHAFAAQRPYVELEVRQDLLADDEGVETIVRLLAAGLTATA